MKKLLLTGLITLSLAGLVVGCGNKEVTKKNMPSKTEPVSSSTSSNELKNNEIKESEDKAKSATKTKDETKPKEEIEVIKNEVKKINNKPQNEVKGNKTDYKSKKFGFSLTFPESWKGKYRVEEKDNSLSVYFQPKEKVGDGLGLFFTIIKKTKDLNEEFYDSIYGCEKYYKINGETYFLGGPTDVNFPETHAEFKTFLTMKKEIPQVMKTFK
ncbi:hypothetical protein BD780_001719 [Clostridium tetanomorphum]|uniref:Lipoprotein n=1 Tax=Clostridium tetanomorphum TaxID=1553 RepID=A0A923E8Y0_CLOTT|nr:hypothetical protein [Clostridium tetanomorphum]KAJ51912.1 hypothetical protein CTM_10516 [Clostridium tetanomorphum DSM 665]MBC2398640.1 hypothetical protein [Clostridium tetanomorphum]MBP1864081.1 hypothetical protein [Clostridium tetanomorphum]NRS84494.1 hypothetical protein [Clostridium tetanomorphum]NRZ97708.1 hypothetical protein [Clostridium tetanomorphum]